MIVGRAVKENYKQGRNNLLHIGIRKFSQKRQIEVLFFKILAQNINLLKFAYEF